MNYKKNFFKIDVGLKNFVFYRFVNCNSSFIIKRNRLPPQKIIWNDSNLFNLKYSCKVIIL